MFGVAGEIAGERARGPGSFAVAILDALYALDRRHAVQEKARVHDASIVRLYAIVDPERAAARSLAELARAGRRGRRDAGAAARQAGRHARMIEQRARDQGGARGVRRAAADQRPRRCGARGRRDGVHIGWDDMRADDARRLLGRDAIIGLSIKTRGARGRGAARSARLCRHRRRVRHDLEGQPNPPIGIDGLAPRRRRRCARASRDLPIVRHRRHQCRAMPRAVIAAGADGVSVISALSLAPRSDGGGARDCAQWSTRRCAKRARR